MAGLLTLAVLGASLSVDAFAAAVGGHMLWQAFKPPAALPDETEASQAPPSSPLAAFCSASMPGRIWGVTRKSLVAPR